MKKILYVLTTIGMLSACIDDCSTSFQFDMPDVSIAANDAIVFNLGSEAIYAPTIDFAGTNPNDYEYLWTLNGREELSHEQELRHIFTESGEGYLTFQMIHRTTGLVYGRDFKMSVSTPFFLGWVILSEQSDGNSALSFVHMTTFDSYPDIYKTLYPNDPLGSEPYRLAFHGIAKSDQILVMQRGGDGLVELNGSNFQKVSRTEEEFIGERYPKEDGGFKPAYVAYTHKGPELLLTENGNIYDRITPYISSSSSARFQSTFYSIVPFMHSAGNAEFTRFTFPASHNYLLMFDNKNKRWLAYYNTTSIPYAIPAFKKGTGWPESEVFDFCSGMSDDVELIYAETFNESGNNCSLLNVFRKEGAYYTSRSNMTMSTTNHSITVNNQGQRTFAPAVDQSSEFCLMRGSGTSYAADPHLFFNIGKKVYFYHWDTDQTYLYKDFGAETNPPAGNLVCMLQNGNATQIAFAFSDGHFFICDAAKNTLTAIRQGNIDPEGDNSICLAHIDDIPGEVKYAIFKYGKATNYTNAKIAY